MLTYAEIDRIRSDTGAQAIGLLQGLRQLGLPVGCEANTKRIDELLARWAATMAQHDKAAEAEQAELRG